MLARFEVLRLDGFLRVFDALADEARLDGDALRHPQAVHQSLHALATENSEQIVFQRKEESRRSRIALTAGASAKLIVDAPRLMAFGAQDMQPAHSHDFVVLGAALFGELVVNRLPLFERNLKNLALLLEKNHGNVAAGRSAISARAR